MHITLQQKDVLDIKIALISLLEFLQEFKSVVLTSCKKTPNKQTTTNKETWQCGLLWWLCNKATIEV